MAFSLARCVFWGSVAVAAFALVVVGDDLTPHRNPLRRGEAPAAGLVGGTPSSPATAAQDAHSATAQTGERFDPIEENGEYFIEKVYPRAGGERRVPWPAPKLALVITGREDGYIEPCGCAGIERMKGGLMRRGSLLDELRRVRRWPVVAVDVGSLVKGFGAQAVLKFQVTVNALAQMGYAALAPGVYDLRLPATELLSVAADSPDKPSPYVSASAKLLALEYPASKRIVQAGKMKVGITSVLGKTFRNQINNPEIDLTDPETALQKILPELKAAHCDVLVLLAHATKEESEALATKFPEFDVVVTAGGGAEPPPAKPQPIGGKTLLVEVGEKGMAAVVLGFYDDRIRYQRVLLDSRYPNSPAIKTLFAAYQDQLKEQGLSGLGIRPVPYPRQETLGAFVGSEKCRDCHEESYKVWKKVWNGSSHSRAYGTLVKADPPRNFDPECIGCHTIGWDPANFFPYRGGFWSTEKTPHLINVGCESCHGAGGAHCDAEVKNDKALQEKLQKAVRVTKAEAEKRLCITCHDLDNSPAFDFKTYWPKVEHKENQEK